MNEKFEQTVYTLGEFKRVDLVTWGTRLKAHHLHCMQAPAGRSQIFAWKDCYDILQEAFKEIEVEAAYLVFEYELPRERGRRPDVLVLSGNKLIVLEFKGYQEENQAQLDQVKHYGRDLEHYHLESRGLELIPVVVLAKATQISRQVEGIQVVSGDLLSSFLKHLIKEPFKEITTWFESEYVPLPSLVQAAQQLFKTNNFPQIKLSQSAGIPETLEKLHRLARQAAQERTHHLALITGVPGAGKTLVGLQFVFEYKQEKEQKAVFLSGNGPLVKVLQKSLSNRHFVQDVHGFLKQYVDSHQQPREQVIIYDEAQRAWDAEQANAKRKGANSEPVDFIRIAEGKEHCLLIGLIGEGQEIYIGEESGMPLWTEAVQLSKIPWKIHGPEKLQQHFKAAEFITEESFNLTTSLRTHQALTLQEWVEALLSEKIEEAKNLSNTLFESEYPIYVTRSLEVAKKHLREKYAEEPEKTYGLLASSKEKILPRYGVLNGYYATSFQPEYYVDPTHPSYCRNLQKLVTEFGCQGLELDMPLLCWEADWVYQDGWKNKGPNTKAKDPDRLKLNSYRVLLTRGRDGLVIFVPPDSSLYTTYQVLQQAGCKPLKSEKYAGTA